MYQGILSDREIAALCHNNTPGPSIEWAGYTDASMLDPFVPFQEGKPSYGLGSFGYDLRLGINFLVHKPYVATILDPVQPDESVFEKVIRDYVFILQPHSQVLAETVERFNMPEDILAIILGKSSYARLGLHVNATPAEPLWKGILTLELANFSPLPIKLHVRQGIAQVIFFRGGKPARGYTEKEAGGAYQNQQGVTLPR